MNTLEMLIVRSSQQISSNSKPQYLQSQSLWLDF
jgi:hypothetical protein